MAKAEPNRQLEGDPLWYFIERLALRVVRDTDDTDLKGLADIRAAAEEALRRRVRYDRAALGRSWAEIGRDLGVSTQAAQQRYGRVGNRESTH